MEEERSSAGFGLERERSDAGFGLEQERRGGGFEMEEERSGAAFRLEQERSGGGLRGEERKSGADLGSIFLLFCVFWVKVWPRTVFDKQNVSACHQKLYRLVRIWMYFQIILFLQRITYILCANIMVNYDPE